MSSLKWANKLERRDMINHYTERLRMWSWRNRVTIKFSILAYCLGAMTIMLADIIRSW